MSPQSLSKRSPAVMNLLLALALLLVGADEISKETCRNMTTFVAVVRNHDLGVYCHAALLNARWAITLPMCVRMNMHLTIMPEEPARQKTRWAWKVYRHPNENVTTNQNDIAVLRIYGSFVKNNSLRYAKLSKNVNKSCSRAFMMEISPDESGRTASRLCTPVRIVAGESCDAELRARHVEHGICAVAEDEGVDACAHLNHASPLICAESGEIVALTPYTESCDGASKVKAFVRVDKYLDFIRQSINAKSRAPRPAALRGAVLVALYSLYPQK